MKESKKNISPGKNEELIPHTSLEKKLIASELRYRRLFESAKDGILILDAYSGRIIDVNPFLIKLLGFTKEAIMSSEIWELGFFKDIAANKEKFLELQNKEYIRYENLPLETIDGRKINVEFVSNVYLEDNRKIIQCNIRDITERRKNEKELEFSEIRRRTLLQTIPDLIWLKDVNGVYLACNAMFERFFGSKEADIVGKTDYDFTDFKQAESFRENDRAAMYANTPVSNEELITFSDDGHKAYIETIKAPMYDTDNNLIGILGIGRDITERKKTEKALAESEIKFRSFFENSMDAILLTGTNDKILSANNAACCLFGYGEDELTNLGFSEIEDTTDVRLSILMSERAVRGNAKGEVTFVHKNGNRFPAEISTSVFKNSEGEYFAGMIIHDISERKQREEELISAKNEAEHSNELKTAFLANMSHEIRTPMNGIIGFTELLKEPSLTVGEQKEYLEIIEKSGFRLLNIINDIISISKIESGVMEIRTSPFSINKLIEDVYYSNKPESDKKNLKMSFTVGLPENESTIRSDKDKVFAILFPWLRMQ